MSYVDYETCGACDEQFPYGAGHDCAPKANTARYYEAPDAYDEPTIWLRDAEHPDRPIALLRRCDLLPRGRHLWPLIVEAVTR